MYNLFEKYINLYEKIYTNQAFTDSSNHGNLKIELEKVEQILIKWAIENNINIKNLPVPQRLILAFESQKQRLTKLDSIKNTAENAKSLHFLKIESLSGTKQNFKKPVIDFINLHNYHEDKKKQMAKKLRMLEFINSQ